MGYGAILGQTPRIEEALAAYDKTIKGTYPIATGNSVTAGDVVDIVNGEVTRSAVAEANVENVFQTYSTNYPYLVRLNETKSVVAYSVSTNTVVKYIDNKTGAASGEIQVDSGNPTRDHTVTRLTDSNYVVGFSGGTGCVFRAYTNGYFGNTVAILAQSGVRVATVPLTATSFMAFSSWPDSGGLYGTVITITGSGDTSSLTSGTYSYLAGNHYGNNISATLLPDDSSGNKRVCVCFSAINDGSKGKAVIATINSSNAVTWGSVVTFNDAENTYAVSCTSNENTVFVSYTSTYMTNRYAYIKILTVNGTSITSGNSIQLQPTDATSAIAEYTSILTVGNKVVVSWTQGNGYAQLLSLSGETITHRTTYKFNTSNTNYISAATIDSSHFIIAYADGGNNNYGTSTILEVNGNQIAGGFTVNSTQAIALESGEAGQEIEVIFAGTTAADFVTEGQKIQSDGVYGYGPMAGWLNVIPYWAKEAGVRIATGSYVGTDKSGSANPNMLTFEFEPKLLVISGDNGSQGIFVINSVARAEYSNSNVTLNVKWEGKTVTWWARASNEAAGQLNSGGTTYCYVAIG